MSSSPEKEAAELRVPLPEVVRFVRQLSHDLRNHLNAADLQSAYLKEIAGNAELKEEITRLRAILTDMSGSLQRLTALLVTPKLTEMPYEAAAFVEDLQAKVQSQFPEQKAAIDWQVQLGASKLQIDPQLLQEALLELFRNAFLHGRGEGQLCVAVEDRDRFRFTLREPKKAFIEATENWGCQPFRKLQHGHYGLGLHRVHNIIAAHHGTFAAHHDPASSSLVTTITLPLAGAA